MQDGARWHHEAIPGIRVLPTSDRLLGMTFDDGPDAEFTPKVLDILERYGVRVTFFCLGAQVDANPSVARRIVFAGHQIANHSWSHPHAEDVTPSELLREIAQTTETIHRVTGERPRWFRPPYGELLTEQAREVAAAGYRIAFWSVDSLDWSGIPGPQIVANVVPSLQNGAILLHHSAGHVAGTVDALPYEIELCLRLGYRFVRLDDVDA
ncbi:MAG: polysaccharide deacetylase family protein [Alicyclobacillus sp.]|nr:polysaccharide deacetylase family protein [Alicyclobacillus sp.]